jgi:hypothetical protein
MRSILFFVISLYMTGCVSEDSDTGDSAVVYSQDASARKVETGWRPVAVSPR